MRAPTAMLLTCCSLLGCVRGGFNRSIFDGTGERSSRDGTGERPRDGTGERPRDATKDGSCSPAWRCGFDLEAAVAVPEINGASNWNMDPVLSRDCLSLYLGSTRAGGLGDTDLWQAQRASRNDSFGSFVNLAALNTPYGDDRVVFTSDGLQAFLESTRRAKKDYDIWTAARASTADPFGTPTLVTSLSTAENESHAVLSADGLRLYYVAGAQTDFMMASRPTLSAGFVSPVAIPELSSVAEDGNPTLSEDELFVIFSSARAGSSGLDLWYARRSSRQAPFGTPERLPTLNTAENERDPFLACGDTELWFVRDSESTGRSDVYRSRFVAE